MQEMCEIIESLRVRPVLLGEVDSAAESIFQRDLTAESRREATI